MHTRLWRAGSRRMGAFRAAGGGSRGPATTTGPRGLGEELAPRRASISSSLKHDYSFTHSFILSVRMRASPAEIRHAIPFNAMEEEGTQI